MTLVMESQVTDYRLERWIALLLALLFFLPFVAQAQEAPTPTWECRETNIDGFRQCALVFDGEVLTWRMAAEGDSLDVRVDYAGDLDGDSRTDFLYAVTRNGRDWQEGRSLSSERQPLRVVRSRPGA